MNNIIFMKDQNDWLVMNMVKQHIQNLKKAGADQEDIKLNEAALRSFFRDIHYRAA